MSDYTAFPVSTNERVLPGIDMTGKIALVRYGGNFRGLKVKVAQDAGAAGILIYTDPSEDGECRSS